MTEQQKKALHHLVTGAPRSVWRFGLFVVPALLTVASLGLYGYVRTQVSDLEIVFRHEYRIVGVWNAQQVAKILPGLALLLTMLLAWIAGLGWLAYLQTRLLKAAAADLGIAGDGASEFWKRRGEISRAIQKTDGHFLLGFFIGLGALVLFGLGFERAIGPDHGDVGLAILGVGFFGLIALLCVMNVRRKRALIRGFGLECTQCGFLPGPRPEQIFTALETGVCGRCGGKFGA